MIYLNYNDGCPISFEALDAYNRASKDYKFVLSDTEIIKISAKEIANLFNVMESEIIFTSGVIEANNLALVGTALANQARGNHIIVSKLESKPFYKICDYLTSIGFEISYVNNDQDGLIDFDDLRSLVKESTILVSISGVNANMGIRQPLKMIRQIIKKENPNTLLHSDLSNAIGKVGVNFYDVDLASVSSNMVFGPTGIGVLYRSESVKISPLTYGSYVSCFEKSITLIDSFKVALKNSLLELEKKERFISLLNEKIVKALDRMPLITLNKTNYSVPQIINLSIPSNAAILIAKYLEEKDIIVHLEEGLDTSVMAVYQDKKRATNTLIISLSYKTTTDEINTFTNELLNAYNKYCN